MLATHETPQPSTTPPRDAEPSRLRVLCIDDDPNLLNSLSRELKRRRANPIQALHGMQGYWLACTEQPDVIVVDLVMPRGNGKYVIECLKRNSTTREVPIVVLSGAGDPRLWKQIANLQVDAILKKPIAFGELFDTIRSVL